MRCRIVERSVTDLDVQYDIKITGRVKGSSLKLSERVKTNLIKYAFESGSFDFEIPEAYLLYEFDAEDFKDPPCSEDLLSV